MAETPHNRVALVTGAGSGIGRACAVALLATGWRVVFVGRRAEALEAAIASAGGILGATGGAAGSAEGGSTGGNTGDVAFGDPAARALAVPADIADEAAVDALFGTVRERFGRLDLLFNNAGVSAPAVALEDLPLAQWRQVVDTNLTGTFLCTRAAFRLMKAQTPQGGRIINNGSISAHAPRPRSSAYTATKHAITGLTKAASLDGRPYRIAVGQIDIGNAETEMTERMARGVPQADGSLRAEARMNVRHVADAVVHMAGLPLDANVLFMTVMATAMPFVGRG